jgi:hypothetical protein
MKSVLDLGQMLTAHARLSPQRICRPIKLAAIPGSTRWRPRDPGRSRLDKLLPRLPGTRGVRRLQAVRHRAREHKMMLDHYQQTKNMLVSYSPKKLGFF